MEIKDFSDYISAPYLPYTKSTFTTELDFGRAKTTFRLNVDIRF